MAEMNWFDYKKTLEETDTVIVPIGSTEILGTRSGHKGNLFLNLWSL